MTEELLSARSLQRAWSPPCPTARAIDPVLRAIVEPWASELIQETLQGLYSAAATGVSPYPQRWVFREDGQPPKAYPSAALLECYFRPCGRRASERELELAKHPGGPLALRVALEKQLAKLGFEVLDVFPRGGHRGQTEGYAVVFRDPNFTA